MATFINGGFVAAWTDYKDDRTYEHVLYAQRFDSHLVARGEKIKVNQCRMPMDAYCRNLTALPDGSFLIVWNGMYQRETCRFTQGVFGQHFTAKGERVYKTKRVQ
jgi:hypothetical protein